MDNWTHIISFTYPHEAHLAKAKLESEGIEVQIADELTAQVNNFYSNAIGGVKLNVRVDDAEKAMKMLVEAGYITDSQNEMNFLSRIDQLTSKWPLIGKTNLEVRLVAFIMTILIVLAILIVLLSIPY